MPALVDYFRSLPSDAKRGFMRTLANALSKLFANSLNEELGMSIESSIDIERLLRKCHKVVGNGIYTVFDLCIDNVGLSDQTIEEGYFYWALEDEIGDYIDHDIGDYVNGHVRFRVMDLERNSTELTDTISGNAIWVELNMGPAYTMNMVLPYDIRLANASMPMQLIIKGILKAWLKQGFCRLLYDNAIGDAVRVEDGYTCPEPITEDCSYNFNQHLRELCPAPSTITSAVSDLYSTTVRRVTAAISGSVADDVATSTSSYTDTAISTDSTERSSTTISSVANDTFKWISERTTETYNSSREDDSDRTTYQIIIALLSAAIFIGLLICSARSCAKLISRNRSGRGAIYNDDHHAYEGLEVESHSFHADISSVSTPLFSLDSVLHSANASRAEEAMVTSSL